MSMEDYMERQLTRLHHAGIAATVLDKFLFFLCGITVIVFLPFLHIGVFYRIWVPDKPPVDRSQCDCSCFDTVFRGKYENPVSGYKHLYFNATSNSLRIWVYVVVGVILAYETTRYILAIVRRRKLHFAMFVVFLSSIYPHYYGWWGLINYINEDFYDQWNHQMFFTATELVATYMVLHLCDQDNRVKPAKLLLIMSISIMHIILNSVDQLVESFFFKRGWLFENVRNFSLLIPDLLHVLVPFFELQIYAEKEHVSIFNVYYKEELMLAAVMVTILTLLGKSI